MPITTDLTFRVNLDEALPTSPCQQLLMAGDQQAHRFTISCYRNHFRESVDLTHAKVHGYFVRNGKETIILEGETSSNTATLTLPAACYALACGYSLVIKLRLGDVIHTVLWCQGKVCPTSTEEVIDPGQVLPGIDALLAMIDQMEQTTARAEAVFNMTAEAFTLPAGSAATASYQEGKLTLGIPQGLDSDTALPLGYKPFDMLVIGPDGKPRWEERTHYDYTGGGTILPLTDLPLIGGMHTFKDPFDHIPEVGVPYHVTYYGYDYNLVAKEWLEDGKKCVTLGNQQSIGGTDWTQEPFIFVFYPEKDSAFGTYGYFSCSATTKDNMPVSIEGAGPLKKLDAKFLPAGGGGGGGGIFFCGLDASSVDIPICIAYKDQGKTIPMSFSEGFALLNAGPVSLQLSDQSGEIPDVIYLQPLGIELNQEAQAMLVTISLGNQFLQLPIVFSDSILD